MSSRARKVVFYSVSLQRQRQRSAEYLKYLPIIIVLTILFGALSVLLGLWRGTEAILISAL
jgi:hypothetical protein